MQVSSNLSFAWMLFMIPAADPNYAPWKLPCAYGINHDYNILMAHQGIDKGEGWGGKSIGWHYVCLFCRAYVVSTLLQLPIESQLKLHAIFPQQRIKSLLPPPTITRTTATTTTRTTTRKVSREIIKILITQLYGKLVDPISHRSLKSQR